MIMTTIMMTYKDDDDDDGGYQGNHDDYDEVGHETGKGGLWT